jgi:hypothetical protein
MLQVGLRHLLSPKLSRKTLHKHRDNLWLLGGELIRDLHEVPRLRKRPIASVGTLAGNEETVSVVAPCIEPENSAR